MLKYLMKDLSVKQRNQVETYMAAVQTQMEEGKVFVDSQGFLMSAEDVVIRRFRKEFGWE